jgi:hypothetical protein
MSGSASFQSAKLPTLSLPGEVRSAERLGGGRPHMCSASASFQRVRAGKAQMRQHADGIVLHHTGVVEDLLELSVKRRFLVSISAVIASRTTVFRAGFMS